jgi:hypothetical protein
MRVHDFPLLYTSIHCMMWRLGFLLVHDVCYAPYELSSRDMIHSANIAQMLSFMMYGYAKEV